MFKFNNRTPKKIKFNGLNVAKLIFNGIVVWVEKVLKTVIGYPAILENSTGDKLENLRIYGNSVQNGEPTPESPVEVESVGNKTKNLFNVNDKSSFAGIINENSWVTLNKNNSSTNKLYLKLYTKPSAELKTSTNYKIVVEVAEIFGGYLEVVSSYNDISQFVDNININSAGTTLKNITTRSKFSSSTTMLRTQFVVNANQNAYIKFRISILEDTNVTKDSFEYEQYGYKLPIKVNGKNLLDKNLSQIGYYGNYILSTGYTLQNVLWSDLQIYNKQIPISKTTWYVTNLISIEPNTIYSYSGLVKANNPAYFFLKKDKETVIEGDVIKGAGTFTTPENAKYIVMSIRGDTIDTMMLEKGNKVTKYEAYVEPTTYNIYLDEPLRKLDDAVDYIDLKNKEIVRNVEYVNFTKTSQNTTYDGETSATANFSILNSIHSSNFFSNMVIKGTNLVNSDSGVDQGRIYNDVFQARIKYPEKITKENTKSEKKAGFDNFFATNNINIIYPINELKKNSIDMPEILTTKGTNIITVDTTVEPSNMEVSYYAKEV